MRRLYGLEETDYTYRLNLLIFIFTRVFQRGFLQLYDFYSAYGSACLAVVLLSLPVYTVMSGSNHTAFYSEMSSSTMHIGQNYVA